jgi:hypothetical protein
VALHFFKGDNMNFNILGDFKESHGEISDIFRKSLEKVLIRRFKKGNRIPFDPSDVKNVTIVKQDNFTTVAVQANNSVFLGCSKRNPDDIKRNEVGIVIATRRLVENIDL